MGGSYFRFLSYEGRQEGGGEMGQKRVNSMCAQAIQRVTTNGKIVMAWDRLTSPSCLHPFLYLVETQTASDPARC